MVDPISPDLPLLPQTVDQTDPTRAVSPAQPTTSKERTIEAADPIGLLAIEQWDVPEDSRQRIRLARFEYFLAYAVLNAMSATQDQKAPSEETPGPELPEEIRQATPVDSATALDINGSAAHTLSGRSQGGRRPSGRSEAASRTKMGTLEELLDLLDFFSPEKTAHRITEVATAFFEDRPATGREGPAEASRREFVEIIVTAIENGFAEIRQQLENLPEVFRTEIEKTHSLILAGLERFAEGGGDAEGSPRKTAWEKLSAYRRESIQHFEKLAQAFAPGGYDALGVRHPISPATFSKTG